jgi:drug/metabolite transporter (DMT)-like permease
MRLSRTHLAVYALIIANIIWGAAAPIFKWSLESVPPFTFIFMRFFPTAIILLPFVAGHMVIKKQDIGKLLIIALIGVTISISTFIIGLRLTESINAPIIGSSGPIFLIFAAMLFLKEHSSGKMILGALISLLGVLLIIFQPLLMHGFQGSILGNLLLVISTITGVIQTIYLKKIMPGYRATTIVFWYALIGSLPFLPLMFHELTTSTFLYHVDMKSVVGIFYGIVPSTVFAHVMNVYAIKALPASETGIFSYIDPLATIIVALPLLHESITMMYLVGSLLVFAGIFISENRLHWHPIYMLKMLVLTI